MGAIFYGQFMGKIGPKHGPNLAHKLDLIFPQNKWGKIWANFGP